MIIRLLLMFPSWVLWRELACRMGVKYVPKNVDQAVEWRKVGDAAICVMATNIHRILKRLSAGAKMPMKLSPWL